MIEEKDYILREIHRLILLLTQLISKVTGLKLDNIQAGINQIDEVLKSEFDLSLTQISELSDTDFLDKIKDLNSSHIELLAELLFNLVKKTKESKKNLPLINTELIKKNLLMIDLLDNNSKIFSMKRRSIKKQLQDWL